MHRLHRELRRRKLRFNPLRRDEQPCLRYLRSRHRQRSLHGFWHIFSKLPLDVQQRVLPERQRMCRMSDRQLVLWQCEKHMSNQH